LQNSTYLESPKLIVFSFAIELDVPHIGQKGIGFESSTSTFVHLNHSLATSELEAHPP
jgi:hypothetical protein